jgi:hypothetical protein
LLKVIADEIVSDEWNLFFLHLVESHFQFGVNFKQAAVLCCYGHLETS